MRGSYAALVVAVTLAACASPDAPQSEPLPPPPAIASPTTTSPSGPVAAPGVSAGAPAPRQEASERGGDIVVPGGVERQVRPPTGDPRSNIERMEDIRAWDQCVTAVQAAFDSDPMSPQLEMPEDYCARSLGMAGRLAIPESRRERLRQ